MVNFLKYSWLYFLISAVIIGAGVFSILCWGYNYSVDFVGGTNLEYSVKNAVSKQEVLQILKEKKLPSTDVEVQGKTVTLRMSPLSEQDQQYIQKALESKTKGTVTVLRSETVGPILGKEMIRKTLFASVIAIIGILLYMTFAFKGITYAVAAIIALLHDFLVVAGVYSLLSHFFGAQLDTLFVTAVLTSMSFSVHDTIVIFDKMREYSRTQGSRNIEHFANRALTETLVRSINNSMTIIFMLLALTIMGGSTIRFFVATLLVGTITGTYSSPFIATPLVVWFEKLRRK